MYPDNHMDSENIFCSRLKSLRQKENLLQAQLAKAINVTDAAISMMEAGKRMPSYEALIALADYFDISIDYLVGRSDDPVRR